MKYKKLALFLVCTFLFLSVIPILAISTKRIGRGINYALWGMLQRGLSKTFHEKEREEGNTDSSPTPEHEFFSLIAVIVAGIVFTEGLDYFAFSNSDRRKLGPERFVSNVVSGLGGIVSSRVFPFGPNSPGNIIVTTVLSGGGATLVDSVLEKYCLPESPKQNKPKNNPIDALKKNKEKLKAQKSNKKNIKNTRTAKKAVE